MLQSTTGLQSKASHRSRRRLKKVFEQAPAGLDMGWILEFVDKMTPCAIYDLEIFGKHLVTVTNAEHDPVLINGSSNQRHQGVICWVTTGGRQIRSTDHDMAAFWIQHEVLELIEIYDMDRAPRDLLEPRNDGSGKPFPFLGSRNAVDDHGHGRMLTS